MHSLDIVRPVSLQIELSSLLSVSNLVSNMAVLSLADRPMRMSAVALLCITASSAAHFSSSWMRSMAGIWSARCGQALTIMLIAVATPSRQHGALHKKFAHLIIYTQHSNTQALPSLRLAHKGSLWQPPHHKMAGRRISHSMTAVYTLKVP